MWAKTLIPGLALGLGPRMKMKSLTSIVMRDSVFGFDKPKPNFFYSSITIINNQFKSRSFTTKANESSPPGPFDSPLMQSMQLKIKEHLNAELVRVTDAYGDGRHVSIDVVSLEFEGKSAVNRQRMVYSAIREELQTVVHAVDRMTTRTPSEAASQSHFDDNN